MPRGLRTAFLSALRRRHSDAVRAGAEPGAVITAAATAAYGEISRPGDTGGDTILRHQPWTINEVAAKGDPLDWFELYNSSDSDIALGSFVVADDLRRRRQASGLPVRTW